MDMLYVLHALDFSLFNAIYTTAKHFVRIRQSYARVMDIPLLYLCRHC